MQTEKNQSGFNNIGEPELLCDRMFLEKAANEMVTTDISGLQNGD